MSINWVMLDKTTGFIRLPGERMVWTSQPRTTLELSSPNSYPGKQPLSIHCSNGRAYLTTQRLASLPPIASTPRFQSFSAPILNLQDTHVTAPFFGANVFAGILKPVPGGNFPSDDSFFDIKMTFKEGGAFDFSAHYDRLKERMSQTVSVAQESGSNGLGIGGSGLPQADLEQLPAYSPAGASPAPQPAAQSMEVSPQAPAQESETVLPSTEEPDVKAEPTQEHYPAPDEPPPGYEETQAATVARDLEENIRRMSSERKS